MIQLAGETVELNSLIDALKLKDVPGTWRESWDSSMASLPSGGIWFLRDAYLREVNRAVMLDEDAWQALLRAAAVIRADQKLGALAWHLHRLLFASEGAAHAWTFYFPNLEEDLGPLADMFTVIVLFSGFGKTAASNAAKGIPHDIILDTFSDVNRWMRKCLEEKHRWGLLSDQWFIYHFSGRLYKLGRLQFAPESFGGKIKVFRNTYSGNVAALSEEGIRFRRDGQVDGTNDLFDPEGGWVSRFESKEGLIRGHLISPKGHAVREMVELCAEEWRLALSCGDPVLDMHIPREGRMDFELCGASIDQAMAFFPKYFPEKPFRAFTCGTWLFDPQFQELLPPSSNIVRFQREFYLYPNRGDESVYGYVFGRKPDDPAKAPRDTQLRRAILDHLAAGGQMRGGGGVILREDLAWGMEKYQKGPPIIE